MRNISKSKKLIYVLKGNLCIKKIQVLIWFFNMIHCYEILIDYKRNINIRLKIVTYSLQITISGLKFERLHGLHVRNQLVSK